MKTLKERKEEQQEIQEIKDSIVAIADSVTHGEPITQHVQTGLMDADSGLFLARELEVLQARSYDYINPALKARDIFKKDSEVQVLAGMSSYTYKMNAVVAKAELGTLDGDCPTASVTGQATSAQVTNIKLGMRIGVDEINAAMMANTNIHDAKARAVVKGIEYSINDLSWYGNSTVGIPGFLSNTQIPASSMDAFENMTGSELADAIVAQLNTNYEQMNLEADMLVVGPDLYTRIKSTRMDGTLNGMTVLSWLLFENNTTLTDICMVPELKAERKMLILNTQGDFAPTMVLDEMKWNPVQPKGFGFETLAYAVFGGIKCVYPLAHTFVTIDE